LEAYDHSRYPVELGIPEWLARLEDTLFENMSMEKSRTWPLDFLSAIKPGADLERIKGPFLIVVLKSVLETFDHKKFPQAKAAVDGAIALWEREDIGSPEFLEAARAARAAAKAAKAAEAAAWAAAAAEEAAAWAAAAAAEAVEEGAAKFDYFADELLKLL